MDYDAPQYMSFERVKLNGYEDSPADEWFGRFPIVSIQMSLCQPITLLFSLDRHGSSPYLTLGPESASSEQHGFMPVNKDNKEEEGQSVLKTQTSKDIEPGLTACQSRKLAFENAFADVCAVCDVKKLPKRPQNKRYAYILNCPYPYFYAHMQCIHCIIKYCIQGILGASLN